MSDCPLGICDGSGWVDMTDYTGGQLVRCPCGQARLIVVARLAATLEAEADYPLRERHLVDVGPVVHRIRHALGLVP